MKVAAFFKKYKIEIINILLYITIGFTWLYLCSFKYFYQDDFSLLYRYIIRAPGDILNALLPSKGLFYRPLAYLSWGIDHLIWGANYLGYYFTNILLHIISLFLLYLIVLKLTKNKIAALLSELAFLMYFPLNSGPISLLACRSAEMQALFSLLTLYFFAAFRGNAKLKKVSYLLALIFFALGVFSKEGTLLFPLILFAFDSIYGHIKKEGALKNVMSTYLPFFLVALTRVLLGKFGGVMSPFTLKSDYYRWVLGLNVFKHLIYYSAWLFSLIALFYLGAFLLNWILKLNINVKDILVNKLNLFFLIFIFVEMAPYLPLYKGEQLGWMQLSSYGAAAILGVSICNFLRQVYLKDIRKFAAIMLLSVSLGIAILLVFGFIFLPTKYGRKVTIANYTKRLIGELKIMYPTFNKDDILYVIDVNKPEYSMKTVFVSGGVNAFDMALKIVYGDENAPKDAYVLNESEAKPRVFTPGDIVLRYDGENLVRIRK